MTPQGEGEGHSGISQKTRTGGVEQRRNRQREDLRQQVTWGRSGGGRRVVSTRCERSQLLRGQGG